MSEQLIKIRSKNDYVAALSIIDSLMDAEPDTFRGDLLNYLADLVRPYESDAWPEFNRER